MIVLLACIVGFCFGRFLIQFLVFVALLLASIAKMLLKTILAVSKNAIRMIRFIYDKAYQYYKKNKIRGTELSMIFQDCGAMINPIRKIGNQFIEYIRMHENMSKEEASKKAINMLEQMMLPNPENIMKSYPFQLSGGMRQRVGIAMAMTFNPKLLIADEPTSALDVTTQSQIIRNMLELREKFNTGIIMVTHNLAVAAYISDKIIVMKDGKIVEQGSRDDILNYPKHDYTKSLLEAVPGWEDELYA